MYYILCQKCFINIHQMMMLPCEHLVCLNCYLFSPNWRICVVCFSEVVKTINLLDREE